MRLRVPSRPLLKEFFMASHMEFVSDITVIRAHARTQLDAG